MKIMKPYRIPFRWASVILALGTLLAGGFVAAAPPENDELDNAKEITPLPFTDEVEMAEATVNWATDTYYCHYPMSTVWYKLNVDEIKEISINTKGSTFGPGILVLTGDAGYWEVVGCDYVYEPGLSTLSFVAIPGTTYHVEITYGWWDPAILQLSVVEKEVPLISPVVGYPDFVPELPGGPFSLAVRPGGRWLFGPNASSDPGRIAVMDNEQTAWEMMVGEYPTSKPTPIAAVTNPGGTHLYALHFDAYHEYDVANGEAWVTSHSINAGPEGAPTLTETSARSLGIGGTGRSAGIVYVPGAGGGATDVVIANAIGVPNRVIAFPVLPGGTLGEGIPTETGGNAPRAWPTATTLAVSGTYLFAANPDADGGPGSISAFTTGPGGALTKVAGSPFAGLPKPITGAIAVSPDGAALFAGTIDGGLLRFSISGGILSAPTEAPLECGAYPVVALASHPTEPYLVAAVQREWPFTDCLVLLDTGTMESTPGSPIVPAWPGEYLGGLTFDSSGQRLYSVCPDSVWAPIVSAFGWKAPRLLTLSHVTTECGETYDLPVRVDDPDDATVLVTCLTGGQVYIEQEVASGTTFTIPLTFYSSYPMFQILASDGKATTRPSLYVDNYHNKGPKIQASVRTPVLWPVDFKLKDVGLNVLLSDCDPASSPVDGLPVNGLLESTQGMGTYRLGPFDDLNAVQVRYGYSEPNIAIDVPAAAYDRLGFVTASAWLDGVLDVIFRYSDGTAQTVWGGLVSPNWYNSMPTLPTVISGMDLVYRYYYDTRWAFNDANSAALYECVVENPVPAGIVTSVELERAYDPGYYGSNILAVNAKPSGGSPVSVDLSAKFNRDVIFEGGDPGKNLDGFFDTGSYNLIAGNSFSNLSCEVMVYGNEDDTEPAGGGFWVPDAGGVNTPALRLRAERKPKGIGRVYLIAIRASDTLGYASYACYPVVVPISNSPAAVAQVQAEADRAAAECLANGGAAPAGYFVIGDGPIVGRKQ